MKFRWLFLVGLLLAGCTECFAQKKVVSVWFAEDEDGVLTLGRQRQMATKLMQAINETMYGFQAVLREGTMKDKVVSYTQGGPTKGELRSGMESLEEYFLNPHVYSVDDGVVYIVVDVIMPETGEVLVTGDRDDVQLSNLTEAFSNLALEVLDRLIAKIGTESIVQNYVEFPNLRLQVQTVDVGTCDWATANRLCREMDVSGGGWRLPTEAEMSQILQHPDAVTKLHITLNESFWTSTDGDRQNFKKTVQATALRDDSEAVVNVKSSSTYTDRRDKIMKYNPVPTSSYTGASYKVRAVRKY